MYISQSQRCINRLRQNVMYANVVMYSSSKYNHIEQLVSLTVTHIRSYRHKFKCYMWHLHSTYGQKLNIDAKCKTLFGCCIFSVMIYLMQIMLMNFNCVRCLICLTDAIEFSMHQHNIPEC